MIKNQPVIRASVVIPVFNRGDLLRVVLDGLVNQTLHPASFEVLVCDDGSTEPLHSVIQQFAERLPQLRHLRQENQGPAAARNLGIANAKSDVVIFLDSDVSPDREFLAALTNALDAHPEWQGAEAKLQPTGGRDAVNWEAPRSEHGGHYHTAGIAYRLPVLEAVGGLDENFCRAACEDVELAVQVLPRGTIGFVPRAVVYHPRRQRTVASCWKARKNWRFVQILACRHGFLAWPDRKTRWPRLRTAVCAVLTLPAGRALAAVRHLTSTPTAALHGLVLSAVDCVAGVSMLPTILFASVPARRSRIVPDSSLAQK